MTRDLIELRATEIQVRMVTGDDGRPKVRGYGLVYNSRSEIMTEPDETGQPRKFRELIKPGAARKSLAEADLRVLAHHDPKQILGRRSAGTAKFGEDEIGIWYEADPPDCGYARDICTLLIRGDVDGSSFSFTALEDDWDDTEEKGVQLRTLRSIHVFEMGPVSWPAYKGARAMYRSSGPIATAPAIVYPTPEQLVLLNRLRLAELV